MSEPTRKTAVMVDLETFGTTPNAVITSIGAVRFDPYGTWIDTWAFHIHVAVASQPRRSIDAGTVLWWLQQSDAARNALVSGQDAAADLTLALEAFASFVDGADEIWCNGASFDLPTLAHAFAEVGDKTPWAYWQERDLRTLKALNPQRIERSGTAHHALDDALHQARLVQHILQFNPDLDS